MGSHDPPPRQMLKEVTKFGKHEHSFDPSKEVEGADGMWTNSCTDCGFQCEYEKL
jgi:hypothetical protein